MLKAVGIIIVLILVYFFFIKADLPQYIEFQSEQFCPSKFQAANDSRSIMYRYNSESNTNSDYIMLLKPDSDAGEASDFLKLFSDHFATQGFSFKKRGDQLLGVRDDGIVYMTTLPNQNLVIILVVESDGKPRTISGEHDIFNSLSKMSI